MRKKVFTLLLALTLAIPMFVLPAAAENSSARPYPVYVSLGDSIPAGYGPYNYAIKGFARVDTAYPAIVADNAADEFIPLGRTGFRTAELRYMLDHSYEGDDALFSLSKFTEDKEYYRNYFPEAVSEADLITIQIGSNDVLNYAFSYAKTAITDEKTLRKVENAINETLASGGDSLDALVKVVKLAEQMTETGAMGAAFVKGMMQGLAGFMQNWEAIMKSIYDLNPDAKVVAVGLYNPLKTTKLMSSSAITIGKAFAVIIGQMNMFMQYQSAYHTRYTYVNVEDTEIYTVPPFTSNAFNTQMVGFVHPTEEGHRSIAKKILNSLGLEDNTSKAKVAKPAPKYLNTEEHNAFVSGYSDGTFRPQATATRAEVASMMCALLQESFKNHDSDPGFRDISGHWGENQIRTIASIQFIIVSTTPVFIITPVGIISSTSPNLIVGHNLDDDITVTITSKLITAIQILNKIITQSVAIAFTHLELLIEMNLQQSFNLSMFPIVTMLTNQIVYFTNSRRPSVILIHHNILHDVILHKTISRVSNSHFKEVTASISHLYTCT